MLLWIKGASGDECIKLKEKWNEKILISINEEEFPKMKKKSNYMDWMHHRESGIISREKATHIFIDCENK